MRPEHLPARPDCPEPTRWLAPDNDATETDVSALVGALVTALKPDYVIETGSYYGDTSVVIGQALKWMRRGSLVTVDASPEYAASTRRRVDGLPVLVVDGVGSAFIPTQPIDLLFLDCDFVDRVKQLYAYRPHASPRCVILTHDTALPPDSAYIANWYADMEQLVADGLVEPWLKLPTPRGLSLTRYR